MYEQRYHAGCVFAKEADGKDQNWFVMFAEKEGAYPQI